ncbi:MAG: FtsQ-type POTRA domain-containing protein [Candidatus Melainabacteria bacterium]|nr:FtsQ-type POTRA domain-containing protein [Candidatus Melainabacteria bacterium]
MPRNILSTILFLLLSAGIIYLLIKPVELEHEIIGLKRISVAEIESQIASLGLENKSILEINPQKISSLLEKSPLIKVAKVKTTLVPQLKLAIHIEEAKPWALYRDQLLGDQAQTLIESKMQAASFNSEAITKIYDDFYQSQTDLVELMSTRALDAGELKALKDSHDLINDNLNLIASNISNGNELGHIRLIRVNRINNVFFYSNKLKFIAGMMEPELFERVRRLETVVPKMIELSKTEELAYVDLSLDTDEVLLGKVKN